MKTLLALLLVPLAAFAEGPPIVPPPADLTAYNQNLAHYRAIQRLQAQARSQALFDNLASEMIRNDQHRNYIRQPYIYAPPPARLQIERVPNVDPVLLDSLNRYLSR